MGDRTGYTIQCTQSYGPPLTAFAVAMALNNTVWERAKIENDKAQKQKEDD